MSTLCPYRIIKGDDGLSVKVEWDAHYLTDEQIGMVREYVADIEAENAKLRELVRDAIRATWACDSDVCVHGSECDEGIEYPTISSCLIVQRARELGVEM